MGEMTWGDLIVEGKIILKWILTHSLRAEY